MLKTISSSDLRNRIRHVLNEVGYGQSQYIVEKFGEPTAAIISMQDFHLLQSAKREQGTASLQLWALSSTGGDKCPDRRKTRVK